MYLWINELFYYLSNITSPSCKHPDMPDIIKSSHLWEFVDFQSIKTIALNKVVLSTFVTIHLSRNETEYMIEQLVNLLYNYLGLWWVGRYLNSCHILPSFPSFSVVYLSLLFVMAVFLLLLFSVLITLTANSQLLNKWNISLSFHPWVSTSSRQQESAILATTKENMRTEFSSFSFSGDIEQKSEESPRTLGCQTDHWNRVSQATGLTEGGRSLQSWDSS